MVKGKNSNAMQLGPEDDEPPKRPHCNMEIVVSVDVSSQEEEEVSVEEDSQQKLLLVRSSFDKVSWILSWTSRQDIQWKKLSEIAGSDQAGAPLPDAEGGVASTEAVENKV
ncbi:hypothetical protein GOP47_0000266 [Adiantum capillus-veneris]|uniref:Uncharacterized protein n=1 Tax=Adiantum capillus-veneris TaxID=13818 RepID=A0A9D4ZSQ2_ADICA|nr:hypothetical protein GOP47_0000266 [Adiantum capillus-veneris]